MRHGVAHAYARSVEISRGYAAAELRREGDEDEYRVVRGVQDDRGEE